MSILDNEIAELVSDGLQAADVPYEITLTRVTPGVVDPDGPWVVPEDTVATFTCMGWLDKQTDYRVANEMVQAQDRRIFVLAPTLAVTPVDGDLIIARGDTFTVVKVDTDPATALWDLVARTP